MSVDFSALIGDLDQRTTKVVKAAIRAVDDFGFVKVLGDAQQIAPIDTGFLKASATDEPAVLDGSEITKEIGFTADYAAAVHDNRTAHHDQGEAEFLATSLEENEPTLPPSLPAG